MNSVVKYWKGKSEENSFSIGANFSGTIRYSLQISKQISLDISKW